ncbi:MAG: ATP-binding cassette domain-containing protein [Burkholderiaceae bacterium]|nr:ATP-binding cassette domain-containing protein [Burkholderiaceae bacterium]
MNSPDKSTRLPNAAFLIAENLCLEVGGRALLADLSFSLGPGLSLVRGGDGRGKTSLLRLMAGVLAPTSGQLRRSEGLSLFYQCPEAPEHDAVPAQAWLAALRPSYPGWRAAEEPALIEALGLAEHMAKPMYMLSSGSRRKLGLLAAALCGAQLLLLDMPYAALDGRSCRWVHDLLGEAAAGQTQAWVLADYELPAALADQKLAALIDLGD